MSGKWQSFRSAGALLAAFPRALLLSRSIPMHRFAPRRLGAHLLPFSFLAGTLAAQGSFAAATNYAVGNLPDEIALGDVDGDRDLDFVVAVSGPVNGVAVWRNDGTGNFVLGANVVVASQSRSVALADVDGDGDLDLLVGAGSPAALFVLRNDGAGTFGNAAPFPIGPNARGMTVADLDRDFDVDVAIASRDTDSVTVLRNTGTGAFTSQTLAVGQEPRNVIAADLDRDGLPDLATANHDSRDLSVRRNLGNGAFAAPVSYPVNASVRPEWVTAADVDADGDLDLVAAIGETNGQVAVFPNAGNGTFGAAVYFSTGSADPNAVIAMDFDGDRDVDLATANESSNSATVLANNGTGAFSGAQQLATGANPEALAAGDLDGDGDLDLLVSNRNSNSVSVLRNTSNVRTAPTIQAPALAPIGQTALLELTSPTERAHGYLTLLGIATTPPIVLPDGRVVPLADSSLLLMPGSGAGVFTDGFGVLDGSGTACTRFAVPAAPVLGGITFHFAFVVIDPRRPLGIGGISDSRAVTIQ